MARWKVSSYIGVALAILTQMLVPASAGEVPEIKAKVGPPVIDELMGGCSLTCAFPWDALAEGRAKNKVGALNDSLSATAWTDAHVGDRLKFQFPANLPRDLNGTPFYGIDIANGRLKPLNEFQSYGRLKRVRLLHNGRAICILRLADTSRWQKFEFPDVYLNVGDVLELEILEIFPGKQNPTAAVSEIVLQGAH